MVHAIRRNSSPYQFPARAATEAVLPPFVTDALVVQAQGRTGLTPYARWGNLLALLVAAGACLTALRRRS